jgi:ribosomal protein S18 acetylase RimI-like enzyme
MINLNCIQNKEKLSSAFNSLNEVFASNHPSFSEWFIGTFKDYLTGNRVLLEIEYLKNIVGYALLHYFDKCVKLNVICVFLEFRRTGIAEKACKIIISTLKNKNNQLLFAQVRPEYPNAKIMFEKLGFLQIGTIFNSDEQKDNDLYCLKLNDFSSIEFIKEKALNIYTKNNIVWVI